MSRLPATVTGAGTSSQAIGVRPSGGQGIEQTGDRAAQAAQTNARTVTRAAQSLPFGDGNLHTVAHTANVSAFFPHLLGRPARGAFPVKVMLNGSIPKTAVVDLGSSSDQRVTVIADVSTTIDWWVF